MEVGSDALKAVLTSFGDATKTLVGETKKLFDEEAASKKRVIDMQQEEISRLKGEVDRQVQQISDMQVELRNAREENQALSKVQGENQALREELTTLREENNKMLRPICTPETGVAGSKRVDPGALEDGQPAKAQRTEAAAGTAAGTAAVMAVGAGGAVDDGNGTPSGRDHLGHLGHLAPLSSTPCPRSPRLSLRDLTLTPWTPVGCRLDVGCGCGSEPRGTCF